MSAPMNYLDGNAAAGELSRIFAMDITSAEGQCANCGAKERFAEAHLYVQCPGLVVRCALCGHVLLRFVNTKQHVYLDLRGMTYLALNTTQQQEASN
jgi:DNA-directed RNA polymerase subunit RPC12/RpoP